MIRSPLPFRRDCTNYTLVCGGRDYVIAIGRFADGRAAEVFISSDNPSSEIGDIARDGAVLISIALQCGIPALVMRDAITRLEDGTSSCIIGAALDLIVSLDFARSVASPSTVTPSGSLPLASSAEMEFSK